MRRAGRLAAAILDALVAHIVPGVTTGEIDDIVQRMTLDAGAVPATLGYRGYTKSCCTSINHVVCHGIPGDKALKDGDIVNVDVTPMLDGWHGDTSRMFLVGDVALKARKLVDVTYECLMLGLEQARPGNRLGDISHAIQSHAEKHRYGVVRDFCGHGLGRLFHDSPEVVHAGRPGTGPELKPGMFFTVEPMINIGRADVKLLDDGWTAVTRDRSLSAQFEHSIGITEDGHEVFTKSPEGFDQPALLTRFDGRCRLGGGGLLVLHVAQRVPARGERFGAGQILGEIDLAPFARRRCRASTLRHSGRGDGSRADTRSSCPRWCASRARSRRGSAPRRRRETPAARSIRR